LSDKTFYKRAAEYTAIIEHCKDTDLYGGYIPKQHKLNRLKNMKAEFTAIVKRDGDWWLGWVEEVPGANAQEKTREELMMSLREAAKDILELRCQEARNQVVNDYEEIPVII